MFISGLVIFGIALPITGYSFNEIFKYIGEIPDLWLWIVKYGKKFRQKNLMRRNRQSPSQVAFSPKNIFIKPTDDNDGIGQKDSAGCRKKQEEE